MGDETKRNPLELSDEEVMNIPDPEDIVETSEEEETSEEQEQEEDIAFDDDEQEEEVSPNTEEGDEDAEIETEAEDNEPDETSGDGESENPGSQEASDFDDEDLESEGESEVTDEDSEDKTAEKSKTVDNSVDYKAEYNKILAPFRANGRDVQVKDADQAIQLMQMGAGFNEKMAVLKPSLKILKTLENNDLLDQGKIDNLIDLHKKNPEAITKLIKDSGIDPLEIDLEKESEYTPNTYAVDDKVFVVDEVLDSIKGTESYNETVKVISKDWDEASKRTLFENPVDIKNINDQIANGVFKQIDDVVKHQRMLGNLKGLSDIEAYRTVGMHMQSNNMFKGQEAQTAPAKQPVSPVPIQGKTTPQNPKLKKRRKAAGSTKASPSAGGKKKFNPLAMSDEEIANMTLPQI